MTSAAAPMPSQPVASPALRARAQARATTRSRLAPGAGSSAASTTLYSLAFYTEAAKHLARDGVLATQATSPVYARKAFWSIARTLSATPDPYRPGNALETRPYHAYIPSFGDWGFVTAAPHRLDWAGIRLPGGLKFLNPETLPTLTEFPPDIANLPVEVNTLHAHPLL
jgi:spermidine synthase